MIYFCCCKKKKDEDPTEKRKSKYKDNSGLPPGSGHPPETDMEMNPKQVDKVGDGPKSSGNSDPYIGFEASPEQIGIKVDDKQATQAHSKPSDAEMKASNLK